MASGKILIVDDEESVSYTMRAILELDGYTVTTANNGTTAVELIRRESFDLILTDLRLDDVDGLTILAEVRRHSPDTVAIMLTGYASLESAVKALREGAYDYLFKPCDVEELRATVARGIERRQLGLQLEARVRELETANETIRSLNEDLQLRIDEATAELTSRMEDLARANEEIAALYRNAQQHVAKLKELDELKSRFLSMASHELRTPLTAISGFSQLISRRMQRRAQLGRPSDEEWEGEHRVNFEQLELLKSQAWKLSRLVDELLDVSRIESGRVEFRYAPVDMNRLARDVAQRILLTTGEHPITVLDAPTDAGTVLADQDHVEQVLNNLLSNAIKYSPAGEPVTVRVEPKDDAVVISVEDRGAGIPPGQLEAVFGLFYRAPDSGGSKVGGMGLGLYISKEIVTRHGGRIWAESELGRGSTFYVSLPRVPAAAAAG
jgi:signal transduction histidine kinase